MACVGTVRTRDLQTLLAFWTADEQRLTISKLVELLEEMDPP